MFSYQDIDQIVSTTHHTVNKLLEYKNGPDALALYFRYIQQNKMQNNNQTFSSTRFMMNAMNWGQGRFNKAKKILVENGMIECIIKKDQDTQQVIGHYIKVNFVVRNISGVSDLDTGVSDLDTGVSETQGVENPVSGNQIQNTLVVKENTLIQKRNTLYSENKDFDYKLNENKEENIQSISIEKIITTRNSIEGFKKTIKITDDIKKIWSKVIKEYTLEEFTNGVQKYYDDTISRKKTNDKNGYDKHRFSFYEFIKQSNGLQKWINK